MINIAFLLHTECQGLHLNLCLFHLNKATQTFMNQVPPQFHIVDGWKQTVKCSCEVNGCSAVYCSVPALSTNRLCWIMIDDILTQTFVKMNFVSRKSRFSTEFVYLGCCPVIKMYLGASHRSTHPWVGRWVGCVCVCVCIDPVLFNFNSQTSLNFVQWFAVGTVC